MVNTKCKNNNQDRIFGSLTERMNKYREDVLNKKPYIDAERTVLATRHEISIYKEQTECL